MVEASVVVVNELGLHARAAARFVNVATKFESQIRVGRNSKVMDGKSILGILLLSVSPLARAATYTWDGGGSSNNWSDSVNWSNNTLPVPGADTTIAFGSGPRNNSGQNITNSFVLNSLTFGNLGADYLIAGNALDFHNSSASVAPTINQNGIFAVFGIDFNLGADLQK